MKKEIFLKKYGTTEAQFSGAEKIEGSLDLSSLTSIPEGFNPTVGGSLYLSSLTAIPEGFNPTVGGNLHLSSLTSIPEGFNPTVGSYLYLSSLTAIPEGFNPTVGGNLHLSSLTAIPEGFNPTVGGYLYLRSKYSYIGAQVPELRINKNYFWKKDAKEFALIDGIFCEIVSKRETNQYAGTVTLFQGKAIAKNEYFFIATDGTEYAHATTIKEAIEDLRYKVASEQVKKEPINADTIVSIAHYRAVTGACKEGCRMWLEGNGLTDIKEMKASELLPLLKKTNAYGYDRFKQLVTF